MSEQGNPIKRLLLWLSGAPAESAAESAPAAAPSAVEAAAAEPSAVPAGPTPPAASAASAALQPLDGDPVNDAGAYGVRVVPVDAPEGASVWRAVRVHHLTPEENQGRHHIFLDALDEAGGRVFGAQARVVWPEGEQIIAVEKPLGEPGANFPLWKWQVAAVEMLGLPSDRVENLHTGHPDEPPGMGNTLFHHSFEVVFQRAVSGAVQPLPLPLPLPDNKVVERYLLFGPPASSRTAVYLAQATPALLAYQPTFGFDPQEAAFAQSVVIVGETQDIPQATEDALIAAGCHVERIQGDAQQVAAGLERVLNPGGPV